MKKIIGCCMTSITPILKSFRLWPYVLKCLDSWSYRDQSCFDCCQQCHLPLHRIRAHQTQPVARFHSHFQQSGSELVNLFCISVHTLHISSQSRGLSINEWYLSWLKKKNRSNIIIEQTSCLRSANVILRFWCMDTIASLSLYFSAATSIRLPTVMFFNGSFVEPL